MTLFLSKQEFLETGTPLPSIIPLLKLVRKNYYSYAIKDAILPMEKDKLYRLFCGETSGSKKKIKRIRIDSQEDADVLLDRFGDRKKISIDNKTFVLQGALPTMEIIEWPTETKLAKDQFNVLTKKKYIPDDPNEIIGTYLIPLIYSPSPISLCRVGYLDLARPEICVCKIGNGCCCPGKCACEPDCQCDEFSLKLPTSMSIFYMSDLEPIESWSSHPRMYLYLHLKYRSEL